MPFNVREGYPAGTANGNTCYACGSAQRTIDTPDGPRNEVVVDFNNEVDFEGYLFICETCGTEIGRLLGMATQADFAASAADIEAVRAERDAAIARAEVAEGLVAALRNYDAAHVVIQNVDMTRPGAAIDVTGATATIEGNTFGPDAAGISVKKASAARKTTAKKSAA